MVIVADDQYVNYYIAAKNYDKRSNTGQMCLRWYPTASRYAVNMVRAAQGKGDVNRMFSTGKDRADSAEIQRAGGA